MQTRTRPHNSTCQGVASPWPTAAVSLLLLLAAAPLAADETVGRTVLRSLVEESDAVLDVTLESTHAAPGGRWQELRVHATVWGSEPGERIRLFVHGSAVAETLILSPGERVILGARWLSGGNSFEDRLLGSLAPEWEARAGLAVADGVLRAEAFARDTETVYAELRTLLDAARGEARPSTSELLALLDSPRAAVREGALRRLDPGERLAGSRIAAICEGLTRELEGARELEVLRAYLDLLRSQELHGCDRSLRAFLLELDDPDLADETLDALTRLASERTTEELRRAYDDEEDPRRRGRILRFLARRHWHDAEELCREAIQDGDPELLAHTAEALGQLNSPRSSELLGEFLLCPAASDRQWGLDVLCRRRSVFDRMVLSEWIRRGELEGEHLERARRALDGQRRGKSGPHRG